MKKLIKNYLVKLVDDPTRKPRLYQSEDNLEYGDRVITYNLRADVPLASENAMYKRVDGYVLGTIECSKNTTKKLVEQLGGYYPLAKCEKVKKENKDIFVLMGICNKEDSPITLLEKAIKELKEDNQ